MTSKPGTQSIVFVRTGWMRFYNGKQPGDERPIGGGRYNKTRIGHEQFNFRDVRGRLYGYFQPQMKSQGISLKRVTGRDSQTPAKKVLVIWVAHGVVVGWFRNATLHAVAQSPAGPASKLRRGFKYYCTTNTEDAVLLPIENRTMAIPQGSKGGLGRVNVRYVRNSSGGVELHPWMTETLSRIQNYVGENLLVNPLADAGVAMEDELFIAGGLASGQGLGGTPQQRKAIERRAEKLAAAYFRNEGYDVERYGKPFDFKCTKGNEFLYLEVKGTRSEGEKVFLTAGEVRFARENSKRMILFVVRSIKLKGSATNPVAYGGKRRIIENWSPTQRDLTELSYSYSVPRVKL